MTIQLQVYREAARLIGDHTVDSLSEVNPIRYALDEAWVGGPTFVLRQAAWRFALLTETLTGGLVSPIPGFSRKYVKPSTWLRTHAIYVLSDSKECPIDVREQNVSWHANVSTFTVRYVSDLYLDPDLWTEHFAKAVAAYLAFDVSDKISGDPARKSQMWDLFQQFLRNAMEHDAVPENPWLSHQFDGSFLASSRFILKQGAWGFAQKADTITASGSPQVGFSHLFAKPADYFQLTAAFALDAASRQCPVDMREGTTGWSAATPSTTLSIRYISTSGLDSTTWPEPFERAVGSHLGIDYGDAPAAQQDGQGKQAIWPQYLKAALETEATEVSPWLDSQLDGSFKSASRNILTQGFWRFALKVATPSSSGTAEPGFSTLYTKPADWLRTQAIYKVSGVREFPLDAREGATGWSSNEAIKVRYISNTYLDSTLWPEEFTRVVASYLGINLGDGAPVSDRGEPQLPWPQYLARALDNIAIPENPWLRHQLDGSFIYAATYILTQGFWRFALNNVNPGSSGTPEPGFSIFYRNPSDWMRTQSVYVRKPNLATEFPVNCREGPGGWSANATPISVRYISSDFLDSAKWPEEFMRVVAAYLDIEPSDVNIPPPKDGQDGGKAPWPQLLQRALDNIAIPESPWLKHQFDGSFLSASKSMLEHGFWNFALKTEAPAESGSPITGFSTSFIKPAGWMRTHTVFKLAGSKELPVDCREEGDYWFANEPIRVRYISTSYIDPVTWPEEFMRVVAAYLGIDWGDGNARSVTPDGQGGQKLMLWPQYLKQALDNISLLPNPWLTFQLDGSFAHAVDKMLESGLWKHAIDTTVLDSISDDASPSYAYAFNKPEDWIRTVQVYEQFGSPDSFPTADCDIDFRDEGGMLHANVTPIVLRYLSFTSGRAPENWSNDFTEALLAYLNYQRAAANPQTSGAGLQAKLAVYKEAEKNARLRDEMRERPKMFTVGVLRRSRGGRSNYDREQGWRW